MSWTSSYYNLAFKCLSNNLPKSSKWITLKVSKTRKLKHAITCNKHVGSSKIKIRGRVHLPWIGDLMKWNFSYLPSKNNKMVKAPI